jgi:phenylpropionate dioxygenase-like ring-hydroxylating dioxygenase large terminal subunit
MFTSATHLPHLLVPEQYYSPEQYATELKQLFLPSWQLVCTTADIPRAGDYVTLELFGYPLLVRNFGHKVQAFLNVCAHRHCLLSGKERGSSPQFACQYHGWEYDETGQTRRIPDAKSFRPFDGGRVGLRVFRTATCGQLVFVSLSDDGPDLPAFLGDMFATIERMFSPDYLQIHSDNDEVGANWKAGIENALESYHIDFVHPKTLVKAPPEELCAHEIGPNYSVFRTHTGGKISAVQAIEGWFVRLGGREPVYEYTHRLLYPNLTFFGCDLPSIVMAFVPVSPTKTRWVKRIFVHQGDGRPAGKLVGRLMRRQLRDYWMNAVKEDIVMLEQVQKGMSAPLHAAGGMISIREERIFHFQEYVRSACGMPNASGAPNASGSSTFLPSACGPSASHSTAAACRPTSNH